MVYEGINDQANDKAITYIELNDDPQPNGANFGRRRSNAFSFTESVESGGNQSNTSDNKNESLISTTIEIVKHKDFVNEFRSKRDIELFVSDSKVLLDCRPLDLESIIDQMLSVSLPNRISTFFGHLFNKEINFY